MDGEQATRENGPKKTPRNFADGWFKGHISYNIKEGYKYLTKFNSSKSCVVSVVDTTVKGKNNWVFRVDNPHVGKVPYNHVNINPKISGVPDPHIPILPGTPAVTKGISKCLNVVNKVALPIAVAVDTYRIGSSALEDYNNGTSRNVVETSINIAGTWACGYGGAAGGAAIGTAIFPGVGTIIGGVIGGVAGGIGGSLGSSALTNTVADNFDYDVEEIVCEYCQEVFKWKKYLEKIPKCPHCEKIIKKDS